MHDPDRRSRCDRNTPDGAGALLLEAAGTDSSAGVLSHAARSDTVKHAHLLNMGPSYKPDFGDDSLFLKMSGRKLYEYALTNVPGVVKASLDRAGLGLEDVAKVLLHQANAKMDEAILLRLFRLYKAGSPDTEAIMPMSISWLGNSSVATVPTLIDLVARGDGQAGQIEVAFYGVQVGVADAARVDPDQRLARPGPRPRMRRAALEHTWLAAARTRRRASHAHDKERVAEPACWRWISVAGCGAPARVRLM